MTSGGCLCLLVWAVAIVPGGAELQILTGSADHEIRLWERGKTRRTFRGHTDCVRDLAVVDGNRFLSCSNDATIIMWNLTSGAPIHTFYGHTNFIYRFEPFKCIDIDM